MTPEQLARLVPTDKRAFDALYERLNGHVRTCARRRLRTSKASVLDHVCSEVWWEVTRKRASFKGDSFTAWLLGVTANVCRRYIEDLPEAIETPEVDSVPSSDPALETSDLAQDIRKALAEMPPVERDVLVLRFFREMTFEQVAQRTGISKSEVERVLRSAIERIRPHLKSWGPGESS
jgi:RNA polymerase sigma-70 factor (ECF subfamily)